MKAILLVFLYVKYTELSERSFLKFMEYEMSFYWQINLENLNNKQCARFSM